MLPTNFTTLLDSRGEMVINFYPFGAQPLPVVLFGAVWQRQFRTAAVALVGSYLGPMSGMWN